MLHFLLGMSMDINIPLILNGSISCLTSQEVDTEHKSPAPKMGCVSSRVNQEFRKRQAVKRLRKNILAVQKLKANISPIRIPLRCPMVVMKEMGKELRRLYPDEKFGATTEKKNNIPDVDRKELGRELQAKQLMNQ